MDVIAVISDTLLLNETAFVASEFQLIQWCKVSTTGLKIATGKRGFGTDRKLGTGL